MNKTLPIIFTALFTTACGGNTVTFQCDQDWYQLGEKVASEGQSVRKFHHFKSQCGDRIGQQEKDAYLDGWTKGIITFCTFQNGYNQGVINREVSDVCPYEIRSEFVRGYKLGQIEFKEKMNQMDRHTEQAERRNQDNLNDTPEMGGESNR